MSDIRLPVRLLDGEKTLWSGRPDQGVLFTARDWLLIPFSLLWCGFIVFWETMVLRSNAPWFFRLWGVPFLFAGLYFVVGRFALDAWLRRNTHYALTNQRILISRSAPFASLTSISLERVPDMQLSERPDGRGTIRFGQSTSPWARSGGFTVWTPALDPTPQLIAIDDARRVFGRIQRASRGAA